MRRYVRYLFLAPVIALIPFLLNLEYWRARGIWRGLFATVLAGIAIGLTIAVFFFSFYAALTWIAVRTGAFRQPPIFVQILLGSFAALTGLWLVSLVRRFCRWLVTLRLRPRGWRFRRRFGTRRRGRRRATTCSWGPVGRWSSRRGRAASVR